MATATRTKTTAYQRLQKVKTRHCNGKATAADVAKAKTAYVNGAVKNGKSKSDAERIATKVTNRKCSTAVAGTSRKRPTKRK